MEQRKYKLGIARLSGDGWERTALGSWLMQLATDASNHPRIQQGFPLIDLINGRILQNRNVIIQNAIQMKCDFVLMVDVDQKPDFYIDGAKKAEHALRFFESSFDWLLENPFGIVAAPGVSGPPEYKVNVYVPYDGPDVRDTNGELKGPLPMRRMTHREAHDRFNDPCIEQVTAIGTGLMLIPLIIFSRMDPPYFDDEYRDNFNTSLFCGQDIYFTRKACMAGAAIWCNHYSWLGHFKDDVYGCPGVGATPLLEASGEVWKDERAQEVV